MRSEKLNNIEMTTVHKIVSVVLVILLVFAIGLLIFDFVETGSDEDNGQAPPSSTSDERISVDKKKIIDDVSGKGIYRFIDREAETVCYVYRDDANGVAVGGTGGISCLPVNETTLSDSS